MTTMPSTLFALAAAVTLLAPMLITFTYIKRNSVHRKTTNSQLKKAQKGPLFVTSKTQKRMGKQAGKNASSTFN